MQDNKGFLVVLALGFIVVALAILFAPRQDINLSGSGSPIEQKSTIAVAGQAQFDVDPDKAEVYIRVQTKEPTAKRAQEENSRLMNDVKAALKTTGVKDDEMETTQYNMWPQQKWDPKTQESIEDGYMVQHLLKVTTTDVTEVGDLLDVAVRSGANGLDRVEFSISDKKKLDVNSEALAQASSNAKDKAESIAQGLGVTLGGIASVSESNVGYDNYPRPYYYAMDAGMSEKSAVSAPSISPETVRVSATISIVYKIK